MTHTYALLDVSPACWQEIHDKLKAAGYEDQFNYRGAGGMVIDMRGIGLRAQRGATNNVETPDSDAPKARRYPQGYCECTLAPEPHWHPYACEAPGRCRSPECLCPMDRSTTYEQLGAMPAAPDPDGAWMAQRAATPVTAVLLATPEARDAYLGLRPDAGIVLNWFHAVVDQVRATEALYGRDPLPILRDALLAFQRQLNAYADEAFKRAMETVAPVVIRDPDPPA